MNTLRVAETCNLLSMPDRLELPHQVDIPTHATLSFWCISHRKQMAMIRPRGSLRPSR